MVPPDIHSRLEAVRKALNVRFFSPENWVSLSEAQESSEVDPEAKGPIWVSRVTLPPPQEDHVRQALFQTIDRLSANSETYTKPAAVPVEGEWVGHRRNVDAQAPEPNLTEREKYDGLMRDVSSAVTILYVHGGGFLYALLFYASSHPSILQHTKTSHQLRLPCSVSPPNLQIHNAHSRSLLFPQRPSLPSTRLPIRLA